MPGFRSTVLLASSLSLAFALAAGSPGFAQDRGGGSSVAVADEGREIYEQVCQSCHMADARGGGVPGAMIPALAGNPRLANHDYASIILLKGRGGMPWFEGMLTRPQIAAVLQGGGAMTGGKALYTGWDPEDDAWLPFAVLRVSQRIWIAVLMRLLRGRGCTNAADDDDAMHRADEYALALAAP